MGSFFSKIPNFLLKIFNEFYLIVNFNKSSPPDPGALTKTQVRKARTQVSTGRRMKKSSPSVSRTKFVSALEMIMLPRRPRGNFIVGNAVRTTNGRRQPIILEWTWLITSKKSTRKQSFTTSRYTRFKLTGLKSSNVLIFYKFPMKIINF